MKHIEHIVKLDMAFSNEFIAKSVMDGVIWKLNNMSDWLKGRLDTDEVAIQKMVDNDDVDSDEFKTKVVIFSKNEESYKELRAQHSKLAAEYVARFGTPAPSTMPKEQKAGYSNDAVKKMVANRWKKTA